MDAVILGAPTPAAPALCHHCDVRGFWITARKIGRGQFVQEDLPCPFCQGDGAQVPAADAFNARYHDSMH